MFGSKRRKIVQLMQERDQLMQEWDQLTQERDQLTQALDQMDEVKEITEAISDGTETLMSELARKRNQNKVLFCTECCTGFELQSDGTWKSGHKEAELVAGRMLFCTCGTVVGVISKEISAIGEVVAVH